MRILYCIRLEKSTCQIASMGELYGNFDRRRIVDCSQGVWVGMSADLEGKPH